MQWANEISQKHKKRSTSNYAEIKRLNDTNSTKTEYEFSCSIDHLTKIAIVVLINTKPTFVGFA
jgi:hypothetical protein